MLILLRDVGFTSIANDLQVIGKKWIENRSENVLPQINGSF